MLNPSEHPEPIGAPQWGLLLPDKAGPEDLSSPSVPSWMAPPIDDEPSAADPLGSAPQPVAAPPSPSPIPAPIASVPAGPAMVASDSLRAPSIPAPRRDYDSELAEMERQLSRCVEAMTGLRRQVLEASEREVVALAMAIAERVIGRELAMDPDVVVGWAAQGVQALADDDSMEIVVSPDLASAFDRIPDQSKNATSVRVDPELPAESCMVTSRTGSVDASVKARFAAVADTIGGSDGGS